MHDPLNNIHNSAFQWITKLLSEVYYHYGMFIGACHDNTSPLYREKMQIFRSACGRVCEIASSTPIQMKIDPLHALPAQHTKVDLLGDALLHK